MRIKSYQVYNNGVGGVVMVDGGVSKPDAKKLLGLGSVETDVEVSSAKELEAYRHKLKDEYQRALGLADVSILFRIVG